MQGSKPSGTLKGSLTLDKFVQDLATRDNFPSPCTFKQAGTLVSRAGKDVGQCLISGFQELKLLFFPTLKFCAFKNTKCVYLFFVDFVEVHLSSITPSPLAMAAAMTGDICMEIERRSLREDLVSTMFKITEVNTLLYYPISSYTLYV